MDPNNRVAVSRVVRLAACLWGGTACPLIPVMRDIPEPWRRYPGSPSAGDITRAFFRFFEPDVFVETEPGQMAAAIGASREFSISENRVWDFSGLLDADASGHMGIPIGVRMDEVYGHLFETTYQFKRLWKRGVLRFRGGDEVGTAFFEAAYGMFPKGREFSEYREAYRLLKPTKVRADAEQWGRIEFNGALCPFHFTRHGISTTPAFIPRPMGTPVFIFDPCSAPDVVDFWNTRVIDPDVRPVNVHWLDQCGFIVEGALQGNRETVDDKVSYPPTVRLASSVDVDRVLAAVNRSGGSANSAPVRLNIPSEPLWCRLLPGMEEIEPPTLSARHHHAQVETVEETPRVAWVPGLPPEFDTGFTRGPGWVNVVRPGLTDIKHRLTGVMPFAALNDCLGVQGDMDHGFVSREGHIAFQSRKGDDIGVVLPTMEEAIVCWLEARRIEATASDAGRSADQIVSTLGGLSVVHRVIDENTLKLLNDMARTRTGTAPLGRIRQALSDKVDEVLDALVRIGAVQLGLAARCTHCQRENWYSLDDVASTVGCEQCLKEFAFPQQIPGQTIWRYRVLGPFSTPEYARGGYAVALTLACLANVQRWDASEMTFSTGLELMRSEERAETDLFAWVADRTYGRLPREPAMVVGECKSYAPNAFTEDDIRRLKTLGEWFPGAFIVAACLKTTLSPDEVDRLRGLATWGRGRESVCGKPSRLIVLTGAELFSENVLDVCKKEGEQLADLMFRSPAAILRKLSFATQEAHLGLRKS